MKELHAYDSLLMLSFGRLVSINMNIYIYLYSLSIWKKVYMFVCAVRTSYYWPVYYVYASELEKMWKIIARK